MTPFATRPLPANRTVVAPDGSDVRVLLALPGGSMAHFSLNVGQVAAAVTHTTVDEIWFVVHGRGEMWRKQQGIEETVALVPGLCLSIPLGTHFQFRAAPDQPLAAVCVTMPPWPTSPDAEEAVPVIGPWMATDF